MKLWCARLSKGIRISLKFSLDANPPNSSRAQCSLPYYTNVPATILHALDSILVIRPSASRYMPSASLWATDVYAVEGNILPLYVSFAYRAHF